MLCDAGAAELKCDTDTRKVPRYLPTPPVCHSCWPVGRHRGWAAPRHKAEVTQAQGRRLGERGSGGRVERHRHTVHLPVLLSLSSMTWTGDQRRASSQHDSTTAFPTRCAAFPESGRVWSSPNLGGRGWSGRFEQGERFLPFEKMGGRTFDGSTIFGGRGPPAQKYPACRARPIDERWVAEPLCQFCQFCQLRPGGPLPLRSRVNCCACVLSLQPRQARNSTRKGQRMYPAALTSHLEPIDLRAVRWVRTRSCSLCPPSWVRVSPLLEVTATALTETDGDGDGDDCPCPPSPFTRTCTRTSAAPARPSDSIPASTRPYPLARQKQSLDCRALAIGYERGEPLARSDAGDPPSQTGPYPDPASSAISPASPGLRRFLIVNMAVLRSPP